MRIHPVIVISTALFNAQRVAAEAFVLSLTLVNRQAYVADVSVNGQPTLLQVGTMTSDVWLACARFGAGVCSPGKCDAYISVETKSLCVTALPGATLALGSSSDSLGFPGVPLKVAQYHLVDANASAPSVYTSNGQVYSAPDYSSEQPSLVRNDVQGVLGLGPNSFEPFRGGSKTSVFGKASVLDKVKSFGLWLVKGGDGVGSFVKLGDDSGVAFDSTALIERGTTTPYKLPLRRVSSTATTTAIESWDLSLVGVQFGGDTALFPRKYGATEKPGADAKAVLSLNHPLLLMPFDVVSVFEKAYLKTCRYSRTEPVGYYYSCGLAILDTLPRINLYVNDKVFFLDPVDYTHVSPTNQSTRIVEIWSSEYDDAWILGMPFLRKFPTIFSLPTSSVVVNCAAGSSCRTQTGAFDRVYVESFQWKQLACIRIRYDESPFADEPRSVLQ